MSTALHIKSEVLLFLQLPQPQYTPPSLLWDTDGSYQINRTHLNTCNFTRYTFSLKEYICPAWSALEFLPLSLPFVGFFFLINLFIFIFWLCWVFISVQGLSPVVASGGHSSSQCAGLSPSWPLSLRSTGSRRAGSAIVAHGPSRSAACGIFPDQGSNPCPLH